MDELIESLTKSRGDDDLKARGGVIWKLGEIGDVKAIEPLITAFGAQDKNVRQRAVKALVKIGESAVDPLINALGDEDRWVRWWAAGMLGTIDDTRVVEPLIKALGDEMRMCVMLLMMRLLILVRQQLTR
ncbi:MAG: HEAT repeat domain-containing protein [Euryarchaeota archaeon]|nr:HEAT repeat domain-containing protein [Euryarchaeota archaeon]